MSFDILYGDVGLTARITNSHPETYDCLAPWIGWNTYCTMEANSDNTQISLMRMDGGGWETKSAWLQDTSFCKDRDGVTDLIIGVSWDRRYVVIYNPATGAFEDTGIYDSASGPHGFLGRPTMANGHTILVQALDGSQTVPLVYKYERGVPNTLVQQERWAWNPCIAPDGTWYIATAATNQWGDAYQGKWHVEIFSRNINGHNGVWMTFPSDKDHWIYPAAGYVDHDQGSIGQWTDQYGSYRIVFQSAVLANPDTGTWAVTESDPNTFFGSDIGYVDAIWAPAACPPAADPTTWHIPGERECLNFNPGGTQQGFWVGNPSLIYGSQYMECHVGDPGWIAYKFCNPWGAGIATSSYARMAYKRNQDSNHMDLGIAVGGTKEHIAWDVQGPYVIASDWCSYHPYFLLPDNYYQHWE